MTRSRNAWAPVYRLLLKSQWRGEGVPTCVVAGPNRHRAWLYVHAATPTVLRLHPQVVRFLLDALRELRRRRAAPRPVGGWPETRRSRIRSAS